MDIVTPRDLLLAGLVAAIAFLGGVSAGLTLRWLAARDRRRHRDPRPTHYRGAEPSRPVPRPLPVLEPAPVYPPPPPSVSTRLDLMRSGWTSPRRPM